VNREAQGMSLRAKRSNLISAELRWLGRPRGGAPLRVGPRHGTSRVPCSGFTMVEAVLSTILVSVMLVVALNLVGTSKVTQQKAALTSRGRLLAEDLLAEILQQNYQEPDETPVFGREMTESATSRSAYDDVDDYLGWTASPPVAKDGAAIANSANWKRTVTVERIEPLNPQTVTTSETGAKRITVTAYYRNVPQASLAAVKTVDWE